MISVSLLAEEMVPEGGCVDELEADAEVEIEMAVEEDLTDMVPTVGSLVHNLANILESILSI